MIQQYVNPTIEARNKEHSRLLKENLTKLSPELRAAREAAIDLTDAKLSLYNSTWR